MNVLGNKPKSTHLAVMMKQIATSFLAVLFTVGLQAETACPANLKPVPFHNSGRHQMIVQVSINDGGPYDFLLDTGAQMTVVDRSLAARLRLPASGNAVVAGMSFQGHIKFAYLETLKLGDYASTNHRVLLYDMNTLQRARFTIRGLLGQDFLSGFNLFIDNAHGVLCIDNTGAMEASVKDGLNAQRK